LINRSIAFTNLGIILTTISFGMASLVIDFYPITVHMSNVAELIMLTGFALVLFSRLYLVILSPQVRVILLPSLLLVILAVNVLIFVMTYITLYVVDDYNKFAAILWKLMTLPAAIEILLASFYTFFFIHFIRDSNSDVADIRRRTFYFLCTAQAFIIICDVGLIIITSAGFSVIRGLIFPLLYALKLEFEFIVLNYLIYFARRRIGHFDDHAQNRRPESVEEPISMIFGVSRRSVQGTESETGEKIHSLSAITEGSLSLPSTNAVTPVSSSFSSKKTLIEASSSLPSRRSSSLPSNVSCIPDNEVQPKQMDSIDEMERLYLGRERTE
jgi:hypothetical protein